MLLRTTTNGTNNVQTKMDRLLLALCRTWKCTMAQTSAPSGSNTTTRPLAVASMCSRIPIARDILASSVTIQILMTQSHTIRQRIFGWDIFGTTRPMRSKCLTGMQLKCFATMVLPAHLRLLLVSLLLMTSGRGHASPSACKTA